ncbi:MAG: maturase [Chloroflexi bacterium HGW-Chloroflexi-1]|nr:MAG: maturase [Chloroflexi bacterium HGW-Chloroflexi-1]
MQNAETVLSVIRERGRSDQRLERLYRQLYNPELYLQAYAKLYPNKGALTPGTTDETVDGMSQAKIFQVMDDLRYERFRWTPVRRTYIPKREGKSKRPLGIPVWSDKLVQEVIRMLLEAYYEPKFSDRSHGFRPGRGCHTALEEIKRTHKGTKWFIEGDISKCFDSLDHEVMINILRESIDDERFIRLIENLLKAGYMENWTWNATLSGAPQGGVLSPLLSNIYLDRLDKFVEGVLIPEYTRGENRRRNPEYRHYEYKKRMAKERGDRKAYKVYDNRMRSVPAMDTHDPEYRRLRYVRYADDFLLSFVGTKEEAEEIKQRLAAFLRDELRLELSQAKTLVNHAGTEAARFLGYQIQAQYCDTWRDSRGSRNANSEIALKVPDDVLQRLCDQYLRDGKPIHRGALIMNNDFDIVARYQAEYRGYVQYYLLARNVHQMNRLRWIMETSLLKTLANKYKSTVTKMAKRYGAAIDTEYGAMRGLRVVVERDGKEPLVAEFGGVPLRTRSHVANITDGVVKLGQNHSELVQRLLADKCEMCGSRVGIEVHHIRKLADLTKPGRKEKPLWVQRTAAIRRKTLVVCEACHDAIHRGEVRGEWAKNLE